MLGRKKVYDKRMAIVQKIEKGEATVEELAPYEKYLQEGLDNQLREVQKKLDNKKLVFYKRAALEKLEQQLLKEK